MLETIKQETHQLKPVLESYRACKISHTFPMEKPFEVTELTHVPDLFVVNAHQVIIGVYTLSLPMVNCSFMIHSKIPQRYVQ